MVPLIDRVTGLRVVHLLLVVMHVNGMLGGAILASGLAARALFALLPGLLLVVAFVGFLVKDPAIQQRIVELIGELVPPLQDLVTSSLTVISEGAVPFTVVGVVALLWAASGFFQTLDVAFAIVLGIERRRDPFVRGLIGIGAVAVVLAGVGAVVAVLIVAATIAPELVQDVLGPVFDRFSGTVLLATMVVLAMTLAYRFIPSTRPSWSVSLVPSLVVGLAITLLTELFAIIAPFLAGTASLYGAIAAVFVLLAWLQLCTQVVVMGMAWMRVRMLGLPDPATLPWPTGSLGHPATGRVDDAPPPVPPAPA